MMKSCRYAHALLPALMALVFNVAHAGGEEIAPESHRFSKARSAALIKKCAQKDAAACYEMAMRYQFGKQGVMRNRLKAQGYFDNACALANGALKEAACLRNAAALESFASGECRSLVIYDALCESGSPRACQSLARMKRDGWHPKEQCSDAVVAKFGDGTARRD